MPGTGLSDSNPTESQDGVVVTPVQAREVVETDILSTFSVGDLTLNGCGKVPGSGHKSTSIVVLLFGELAGQYDDCTLPTSTNRQTRDESVVRIAVC